MSYAKCIYSGISERDMDMMFLQLFSTDEGFVRLFLEATQFKTDSFSVESIELSKSDPKLGESDITVVLSVDKKKVGLLIEDKIDAIAMPKQAERYEKRGEKGKKNGEYDEFYYYIVCPQKYYDILNQVMEHLEDYKNYYEDFLRKSYTIGGSIIFPKHQSSMNQNRGTNGFICDRWDLTLECIRRYYSGETSPLHETILADKAFYELFVDFKGYVDFFYLQDCVTEDYSHVQIWCGDTRFIETGLPKTVDARFEMFISSDSDNPS